ncbi:hypothetical protein G7Y79_00037g073130 [Physcia stellaris]|nr:hypothetical protein G7Y79_00037g073130 [Physcia stellaris]
MDPELKSAIDDAQPDRLRETLRGICNLSSEAAQIAGLLLLDSDTRQAPSIGQEERYEGDEYEEEPDSETESANVVDDDALVDGLRPVILMNGWIGTKKVMVLSTLPKTERNIRQVSFTTAAMAMGCLRDVKSLDM